MVRVISLAVSKQVVLGVLLLFVLAVSMQIVLAGELPGPGGETKTRKQEKDINMNVLEDLYMLLL